MNGSRKVLKKYHALIIYNKTIFPTRSHQFYLFEHSIGFLKIKKKTLPGFFTEKLWIFMKR